MPKVKYVQPVKATQNWRVNPDKPGTIIVDPQSIRKKYKTIRDIMASKYARFPHCLVLDRK